MPPKRRSQPEGPAETVPLAQVLARCFQAHALAAPVDSVEDAVLRAAGLYGTTPTCYLSLAARVKRFEIRFLDRALYERRSLVRIPAMRHSGYMMPRELVPAGLALAAASPAARWIVPTLRKGGLGEPSIRRLVTRIESLVAEGPKTATQIRKGLRGWREPFPGALGFLLRHMGHSGRLVATRVRGSWRSQLYEYARLHDWIDVPRNFPTAEEGLRTLGPMYFAANGPATIDNFAWWAGVNDETAGRAADDLKLTPVRVEGLEAVHYAPRTVLRQIASAEEEDAISLIPYWDAYMMAQTDRRRYLDTKWANRVVDKSGNVTNIILREGRVVGIWDFRERTLRVAPFTPLALEDVRDAAERLRGVFEIRKTEQVRVPGPLDLGGQNAFQSPLR